MIGLTGEAAAIAAAADAYRVYYRRTPTGDSLEYTIDHSAFIYLMGRGGEFLGFFPPGTAPDRMASAMRAQIDGTR